VAVAVVVAVAVATTAPTHGAQAAVVVVQAAVPHEAAAALEEVVVVVSAWSRSATPARPSQGARWVAVPRAEVATVGLEGAGRPAAPETAEARVLDPRHRVSAATAPTAATAAVAGADKVAARSASCGHRDRP
jgi:hypothetical protein